ncbi:amidohydrolase family protein [Pseudomonas sp.]|uniref:amidohydrolase family protein n=1 Tax=Pseudomonas sp. TaxID=306 RepID=UPI00262340DA|nr:amidohydrolase family protein [Pseudomonas sp.]
MLTPNTVKDKPSARELLAGIKFIDVDTHVSEWPGLWTDRAPAHLKHRMPRIVGAGLERRWVIDEDTMIYNNGASCAVMKDGGKALGWSFTSITHDDIHPSAYDTRARVQMMDEQGVYAQIAYPNILGFSGVKGMKTDAELRLSAVQIYNDAMGDMQRDSGDRIFPMALLPWWDLDASVKELERCLKWGARGINWNPDTHTHGMPDIGNPFWNPIWEACVSNGLPVNFHIGASDESLSFAGQGVLPSFSNEESMAMGTLMLFIGNMRVLGNIIISRFLENWPDLKIVSVESGAGWVPYLLEGLKYTGHEAKINYATPPAEIFRRQIYACSFFERDNFVDTVRQIGADNVMFETDFPHPSCLFPDGLEYMVDAIAQLTEEERFKVFSGNAAKLYNINIT